MREEIEKLIADIEMEFETLTRRAEDSASIGESNHLMAIAGSRQNVKLRLEAILALADEKSPSQGDNGARNGVSEYNRGYDDGFQQGEISLLEKLGNNDSSLGALFRVEAKRVRGGE